MTVTLDTLRREKKAEIVRLAAKHGCRNVRVFGSVATGENRPDSDVDFLASRMTSCGSHCTQGTGTSTMTSALDGGS